MNEYTYQDYLAVKKSVDDRALNRRVFETFRTHLCKIQEQGTARLIEIGSGAGAMVERLFDRDVLHRYDYTAMDLNQDNTSAAISGIQHYCEKHGIEYAVSDGQIFKLLEDEKRGHIRFVTADALEWLQEEEHIAGFDGILAHAVLDLFHLETAVPILLQALKPGGFYYFTLNYGGVTQVSPSENPRLNKKILDTYHKSMNSETTNGKPRSGSKAAAKLEAILSDKTTLIASGDSPWRVEPVNGGYPDDEHRFIEYLLRTMENALKSVPEIGEKELTDWLAERREHLSTGRLQFTALNKDFFGVYETS